MTSVDGCNNDCGQCNDVCEIERLRSLIAAWADADERYFTTVHTYDSEYMNLLREERDDARDALRKAVGR